MEIKDKLLNIVGKVYDQSKDSSSYDIFLIYSAFANRITFNVYKKGNPAPLCSITSEKITDNVLDIINGILNKLKLEG